MSDQTTRPKERIAKIELDEGSIIARTPEIEHERAVAITDLLEDNQFELLGIERGPYYVFLSLADNRLHFRLSTFVEPEGTGEELAHFMLPVSAFRSVIKDYFIICESYFDAIKQGSISRIEAIDMGRRGVHNEGSEQLMNLLADKVKLDFETSRRLFTLLCVLHIK